MTKETPFRPYLFLDSAPSQPDILPGKGVFEPEYAIVGQSPGLTRKPGEENEPFGQKSIAFLRSVLQGEPNLIYMTNLIKEPQSLKEKPKISAVRKYYPILIDELKSIRPRKILAVGTTVAQVLCPGFTEMSDDHGALFWNPTLNCLVVPTFSFSQMGRDPLKRKLIARDIFRMTQLERPQPPPIKIYENGLDHLYFPKHSEVILDIETTGLNSKTDQIISIGFKVRDPSNQEVQIVLKPQQQDYKEIYKALKASESTLVGHNLQFDLEFLMRKSDFYWDVPVKDTMILAHTLGQPQLGLKHLTSLFTMRPGSHAFGSFEDPAYLAEDVLSTEEILDYLEAQTTGLEQYARDLSYRAIPLTVGMRIRGVFINRKLLQGILPQFRDQIAELAQKLNEAAGAELNWNSSQQVANFLLSQGVELTEKTDTGNFSVKETVLRELAEEYEIAQTLLDYRETTKLLEFLEGYLETTSDTDPYLHPKMLIHGTATGRLSMRDPNLQQVPRVGPVKTIFVPRWEGGKIGLIDLSQAELRVAALLAGDEKFAEALNADDIHRINAAIAYQIPVDQVSPAQRKKSKGVTFGLLYGGSPAGLAKRIGVDVEEVEHIQNTLYTAYPKLAQFITETKRRGVNEQRIETIFGRVRDLSEIIFFKGPKDAARKAINTPIQGTASDIALSILCYSAETFRREKFRSRVLFGVHDSVLIEIHPDEIERVGHTVQESFRNLRNTPLSKLNLWPVLPLIGEFIVGNSWAAVESTNENYDPEHNLVFPCSSHGGR